MALYTFFTHGTAVVAETAGGGNISSPGPLAQVGGVPWTDVLGLPQGFGKTYRGKRGSEVWFHAAVPTPAHLTSQVVVLDDVFVIALLGGGARLDFLHCWDGGTNIRRIDGLNLAGDLRGDLVSGRNSFEVRHIDGSFHRMILGLCVSVHIRFEQEADVRFDSVGASFQSGVA
jgi:hypothetical protein